MLCDLGCSRRCYPAQRQKGSTFRGEGGGGGGGGVGGDIISWYGMMPITTEYILDPEIF